jgi:sarcosine oxidase subunit gamma
VTDLQPTTALGATSPRRATFGTLTLAENTTLALASLERRRDGATAGPAGLGLPGPGAMWSDGPVSVFWTGQDRWMVEGGGHALDDFAGGFALAGPGWSITDQTDAWVVLDITSHAGNPPLHGLLAKLVNIDPAVFCKGTATRLLFHYMSIHVLVRDEHQIRVLGIRSSAGSLWHALVLAGSRL